MTRNPNDGLQHFLDYNFTNGSADQE